jgi:hypothetical protein
MKQPMIDLAEKHSQPGLVEIGNLSGIPGFSLPPTRFPAPTIHP